MSPLEGVEYDVVGVISRKNAGVMETSGSRLMPPIGNSDTGPGK
jgi:hypothetical protein